MEWLAKRAAGIRKVCLSSTGDRGYRTVSLLLALYNSGTCGPELELCTGSYFLLAAPATCQLETGMLTRLVCSAYAVEFGLRNIATCARLTTLHLQDASESVHFFENLHDLQQLVHLQELHGRILRFANESAR